MSPEELREQAESADLVRAYEAHIGGPIDWIYERNEWGTWRYHHFQTWKSAWRACLESHEEWQHG